MSGEALTHMLIGLPVGLLLGIGYFALLHHSVRQFEAAAPAGKIVSLALLRISVAIGVFWALVQLGVWALLAGLAGFLIARLLARRWVEA